MAVSESQLRANARYQAKNYDEIKIRVKKGKRAEYKLAAEKRGMGFAEMVRASIEEYIANHKVES